MAKNKTLPFIKFAGGAWLHGKDVAVYGNDEVRELRAETCGGKTVPETRQIVMSVAEFEALESAWTEGGALAYRDACITRAALSYLGHNI